MTDPTSAHEHDDIFASTDTHGPTCTHCSGSMQIERSYLVDDRGLQTLLSALAQQSGLSAYRKGRSKQRFCVAGPSREVLDRFDERLTKLGHELDQQTMQLVVSFVREHTGISIGIGQRTAASR